MPRLARTVCARVPHHVTQRGNRREDVFFTDADRLAYLGWLKEDAEKHAVQILAYCLMTNHIHLVALPASEEGLERMLKPLHMRYAQRINRERRWKGHLWQGRFFSSALDEDYLWAAIRYVERQPRVRADDPKGGALSLVQCRRALRPETTRPVLTRRPSWQRRFEHIGDWSRWLAEGDDP